MKIREDLTINERINLIAEIIDYGLQHTAYNTANGERREDVENDGTYNIGGIETVAHIAACCISQWITNDSEPTSDVCDILELEKYPNKWRIKENLKKYLNNAY